MPPEDPFGSVIANARAGDPEALAQLYTFIHPAISRYLRAREPADAEDLATDVWLDVASGLNGFEGDEHGFRAWAFTIARRRVIDSRRRHARAMEFPLEPRYDVTGGDVEDEALGALALASTLDAIRELPDEQADIVLLRVLGGLTAEEVAAIVGRQPGTVRVIQHRAMKRLARTLERRGVTP